MADRSTSDAGIPETAERKAPAVSSEALEVDTARDLGPSVDDATHEPAEKNASNQLQVVSRVDDAELDTDSSASSLYEYVSDADVEAVGENSEFRTPMESDASSKLGPDATLAQKPSAFRPDNKFGMEIAGRYTIERLIGKGGMGRVYLAKQQPLNRLIAIKILNRSFQEKDPQFSERFYLEAATAARLNHPNTITVFDYGECDTGELFIAMEYLKGRSLSRVVSSGGPVSPERTIRVGLQIARALRAAHKNGIIHRDLKPGNIMLLDEGDDPDMAKVLDFGLVKLFQSTENEELDDPLTPAPIENHELTHAGMFLGSPKYMSPEQIQGHDLDPRTDIYSLGVILFYMLAGRQPFIGKGSIEIVYQHIHSVVPYFSEINPDLQVPEELEELVRRCLAKDREQRFASMSEVFDSLRQIQSQLSDESVPSFLSDSAEISRTAVKSAVQKEALLEKSTPSLVVADDHEAKTSSSWSLTALAARLSARHFTAIVISVVLVSGLTAYYWPVSGTKNSRAKLKEPVQKQSVPQLKVEITFVTEPSGAEVRGQGVLLGVTPFSYPLKGPRPEDLRQAFVVSKEGYQDEIIEREFSPGQIEIYTRLKIIPEQETKARRLKKSKPRKKPKQDRNRKKDEDYKDNPY